jgi:hypothetical protein
MCLAIARPLGAQVTAALNELFVSCRRGRAPPEAQQIRLSISEPSRNVTTALTNRDAANGSMVRHRAKGLTMSDAGARSIV